MLALHMYTCIISFYVQAGTMIRRDNMRERLRRQWPLKRRNYEQAGC